MHANLQLSNVITDTPDRQLLGLSDLEVISVGTRTYIIASGEADGGVSSYEILADGSIVASDDILLSTSSGSQGIRDITVFEVGSDTILLLSGMADDNQATYRIDADGSFIAEDSYSDGSGTYANWLHTDAVTINGNTYVFGAQWGKSGFFGFDTNADADLITPVKYPDGPEVFLGDVSAIETAYLHNKYFLFVASGVDAGVQSYAISDDGSLTLMDIAPPEEGGFNGITDLATVDNGKRAFVIIASAGSDSLTVFRVSKEGKINLIDTLVDTNETRFANVSAIESFEYNDRQFVLAGGSDGGVTLIEVTYKGELRVVTTFVDRADVTLDNVTDIEVVQINGAIHIFVSSGTENGFTEFVLTVPNGSNIIRGGPVSETLTGTAMDDTIFGHGEQDVLYGMDGNDRLIDGRGTDVLYGGEGHDVFEFVRDKRTDTIKDYEIGIDRIDLSDYPNLLHYSDIVVTQTSNGAYLDINGDRLVIETVDGSPLNASMFDQDDFIFG